MTIQKFVLILPLGLLIIGCSKKPYDPAPVAPITTPPTNPPNPPTPPPVTTCQGATILYTMPVQTIADNSVKDFVIPNFEVSCGDTLQVFMQNPGVPPGTPWTEIFDIPNGASYYSLTNQIVTLHNS